VDELFSAKTYSVLLLDGIAVAAFVDTAEELWNDGTLV